MSKKCPKCQHENPDDTLFCGKCGTQFPEQEKIEVTETMETPKEELTTGSTFAGRYQIIEELGKGGMGRVYKAHDIKIKEKIALKLIKPEIARDKNTIERFSNELRLARKIRHKNVCGMFDLGEEKGTHYITMEFVPGEDLRSLIRRIGQLPIGKSISIAKQICEGLTEAHRLGVVHRDLKSNNIMIDKEGNVRIMDFGIARSLEAKGITGTGVMIGTPEYMSPEQVEGKEVDQRSDIYSLGVILYEMITGRVPFEGDTPFTIGMKHKSEMPKNPKELNNQISDSLSRLILRCLEKEKEKRYQNAGEIRSELVNVEKGIPTTERIVPDRKPITSKEITVTFGLKKLFVPAVILIVIVAIGLIVWQSLPQRQSSIAVLPLRNLSPQKDQEHLCDGMTDEIIAKLSRLQGWKVMNMTSVLRYKDTEKTIKDIGHELNVTTVLLGSVRKEENDIRVTVQLVNVDDEFQLWSNTYEQKLERVFEIQSDVAEKIAEALKIELSQEERKKIQKNPTENLEAYNLYLKGRWFWNRRTEDGIVEAIKYFTEACEKDANYALAYAGLADCYTIASSYSYMTPKEAMPKAKSAVVKALEIDETLSEAHVSLAYINLFYEWDMHNAKIEFERAIQLNPNYGTAHQWYANCLTILGRHDESIAEAKRARELDPLSPIINRNVGRRLYFARRYDQAIVESLKAIKFAPDFFPSHMTLGLAYLQKGKFVNAITELQKTVSLSGDNLSATALLGYAYAVSGNQDRAKVILKDLMERARVRYVPSMDIAWVYIGLSDKDQAFKWLNKAYEERSEDIMYISANPIYDPLRTDPRFNALLEKVGLE